ncbi:hypothetical protein OXPF_27670 [Oxobacter pfennigii]|uniref:Uncharacterized protein n=1 Tax=Oxobacter pfennigii TaxID=36849 RepID=A0A0P8WLL4_9CLOT|nr:OmpH family outer membrane protein [Oxobacter pfennigii]KPU43326.1 hypothetical protein OXPF_27670 [Oxobacter pfennigii]
MTKIDLFIKLLDEREANEILKHFNAYVKGDNSDLKKVRLRTILKGQFPRKKNKNEVVDPFHQTCMRYKQEYLGMLNEDEFFVSITESGGVLPDYARLANLLIYYPERFEELCPMIEDNIKTGKGPFDLEFYFTKDEEVSGYIKKISYLEHNAVFIKVVDRIIARAVENKLIKIDPDKMEEMRNGSLADWHRLNKKEPGKPFMWKYYYLKTHENIDSSIVNSFCLDIIGCILVLYESSYVMCVEEVVKSKIGDYARELKAFKELAKSMENEKKGWEDKLNQATSEIQNMLEAKEKENQELNDQINKERMELKKKEKELSDRVKELEKMYSKEKRSKENLEKKINKNSEYLKYALAQQEKQKYIFGVISDMEINISKEIFKEVLFMPYKNWYDRVKDVDYVYIQREGISGTQLSQIKQYCSRNNIKDSIISVKNEKDLIEQISRLKVRMGGAS